jgi:hypothetical protein
MSILSDYTFNRTDRIGLDVTDNTQRNMQNTRFSNYYTTNNFSESTLSPHTIQFASAYPTMVTHGTIWGRGLNGDVVDVDSQLLIRTTQERPLEKLDIFARPFATVPYLGRGSCNPDVESQLMQGETVSDKKSVATVMNQSFMPYTMYPTDDYMTEHVHDPKFTVEEAALAGWVRGGSDTRNQNR